MSEVAQTSQKPLLTLLTKFVGKDGGRDGLELQGLLIKVNLMKNIAHRLERALAALFLDDEKSIDGQPVEHGYNP